MNRGKSEYYKDPSSRLTASYLLTQMFKTIALKIAKDRNDFNSSYFIWVDFGASHILGSSLTDDVNKIIAEPREKITLMCICYRYESEMNNIVEFCNKGQCGMAGTVFSAEKSYIDKFYSCMLSAFYEQLGKGVGHCDEQVLTHCYSRYPELFCLYYGDYYSAAMNYHYVKRDYYTVKYYFIRNALHDGCKKIAQEAALNVKESINKGLLDIPSEEHLYIDNIINS